jgi:[acyl-carrier-protein] S-malonyltransferase
MKTAIVFPGQGSQVVGMGKDLYQNFLSAKEVFDQVDQILSLNLSKIMFEGPSEELTKTENAQPALMAVSIAIINVLEKEFGKKFDQLCSLTAGHSLGEYSALCAAKSLTLETTAKLLQIRGREMAKCSQKNPGAMAAILGAEIDLVEKVVKEASQFGACQVANDNSYGQIVISGAKNAIDRAVEIAKENSIKKAIILPVSGAFHSSLMLDAQNIMSEALNDIKIDKPIVPIIANVTANVTENPIEIQDLLVKQITGSVRWRETILFMEKQGVKQIIEIGSGKVLCGLVGRTSANIATKSIQSSQDLIGISS